MEAGTDTAAGEEVPGMMTHEVEGNPLLEFLHQLLTFYSPLALTTNGYGIAFDTTAY